MRNRYLRLAEEDPSTYDTANMASSLTSLDTTVQQFYTSQEEIMAYVDIRVDTPFNEDDELAAIETFEDNVDTTKSLINRLMTTKRILRSATLIRSDLDNLQDLIHNHPDQDYAATHGRLTSSFSALRLSVLDSTIKDNHPIHQELIQLQGRIESLSSKDKESTPSSSTSTTTRSKSKSIQLPKLHLPTFSGDLMDWAPFWSQFKGGVVHFFFPVVLLEKKS